MNEHSLDIFLTAPPGLEGVLKEEADERRFLETQAGPGGVSIRGGWPEVWRANLQLRGAGRVLVRLGSFRAAHLSELDKKARKLDWSSALRPGTSVRVEAVCKKSRIYHSGAAAERIAKAAIAEAGAEMAAKDAADAATLFVRIEKDVCTVSIDTSGELLHRRGHKQAVGKAPMRETLAALFLRACGYCGNEPVLDPMCGSGTFPIEAAEVAAGLAPGRDRTFAFERLASFDAKAWEHIKASGAELSVEPSPIIGFDRDAGAIEAAQANAARAGVVERVVFAQQPLSAAQPPDGAPGLSGVAPQPWSGAHARHSERARRASGRRRSRRRRSLAAARRARAVGGAGWR